jgi:hypothetical protein
MGYYLKNRRLQSGSTGVVIPTGSTAQRPDYPTFGLIRFNTDTGFCEFFNGTIFQNMGVGGVVSYDVITATGNGSTVDYTLDFEYSDPTQLIVFVGSIYQEPTVAYTVSSFTLTFTSAPASGVPINIIQTQN